MTTPEDDDMTPPAPRRSRPARLRHSRPPLSVAQILAWADAHRAQTGSYPNLNSGEVRGAAGEKWRLIDTCLRQGLRGLPGGGSVARLLARERGVRNIRALPDLAVEKILAWADAHHAAHGGWPSSASGPVEAAPGETWSAVHAALSNGARGLPGGSSLAGLLAEHRGRRNHMGLPPLSRETILRWADDHHRLTGCWPHKESGPVLGVEGETWASVDGALRKGLRGLSGKASLPKLLAEHRGVRNVQGLAGLNVEQVLAWADAHRARTGRLPKAKSGPIPEAPGETWMRVNTALIEGLRGLPGGSSLARLFAERRGTRNHMALPPLTVGQIVCWAEAHRRRTGRWPTPRSGPVEGVPGLTWSAVGNALYLGLRGLPAGLSLPKLRTRGDEGGQDK